jgi:hypothetical protein
MPPDTSFLAAGVHPTIAAADPRDVALFQQQRQAGAQALQSGALDLQQKQTDLNDQQIFSGAMRDAAGDPRQAFMLAAQRGASGKSLINMQQMMLKNQETQSTIGKNNADAASATAAAKEKSNTMVVGTTGALRALPPSERPAAYPAAMQKIAQDLGVDPSTLPQTYEAFGGDAALNQFHDQHMTQLEQLAAQKAASEKAAADFKLQADTAEEARKSALAKPTLDKATNEAVTTKPNAAGLTADQQSNSDAAAATLAQTKLRDTATAKNAEAARRIEAGKLAIDQKKFDVTFGAGLDANGKPLSPEDRKAAALLDPTSVAQANYQIPVPPPPRNGAPNPQMAKVLAINPSYDIKQFANRNKVAQDFGAAGASGKQITSSDTALAHLDAVSRAGAALKNTDPRFINAIANEFGVQVGSTPKNTYDAIIDMVAPEISKAVIGEAGGETERQNFQKPFSSDASDAQREQAIGATAGLLGARYHKMAQAYESDMGKPLDRKLSPESQAVLDRYSGGGALPQGGGKVIDKATVQQFYQAAGNDPAKARKMATDAGWKLQ